MSRRHSVVRHQANYFYVPLEDDFLAMYEKIAKELDPEKIQQGKPKSASSDCKAMIAAILEGWMNSKRTTAKGEEDLYSYFSIDQLVQQLRGRYKRSVIIQCLGEMEVEGTCTDPQTGDIHTGTIKKRPYLQNMYGYVLNLPVVQALIDALPEQSPYDIKARPILGRPKKSSPKTDGISEECSPKKDCIKEEKSSPKKDGISVKQSKNGPINAKSSPKKDTPFYTQNSNTQNSNNTEGKNVGGKTIQATKTEPDSSTLSLTSSSSSQLLHIGEKLSTQETVTPSQIPVPSESNEVKRVQGYWKSLGLIVKISEHWVILSEHVHSFEEMDSLFKHTQSWVNNNPRVTDKTVHPGNLVNCLNGWKQAQVSLTQVSQTKEKEVVTVGNRHLVSFSSRPRL